MTESSFSPLAWELARRAGLRAGRLGEDAAVYAWIRLGDGKMVIGGATSTEAKRALAVALDEWAAKREGAKA